MARRLLLFGLVALLVGGLVVFYVVDRAGTFRELEPVALERCEPVAGPDGTLLGTEDLTIHRARSTALFSVDDRRARLAGGQPEGNGIYALALRTEGAQPRRLSTDLPGPLNPHGISLVEGVSGDRLFVVNHTEEGHAVEIFDLELAAGTLRHVRTVRDPLLRSPNDVLGIGGDSFYATNDHGSTSAVGRFFEDFLSLARSDVVYYDGEAARIVAEDLAYANGINMSPAGRHVYVAATTGQSIHYYNRDPDTGALEQFRKQDLGTGVDNIEIDRHGKLWVGAHPKLLSFLSHARSAENLSPSQVIWIDPDGVHDEPVRDAYLNLGEELSGSSVAAPFGARVLIGSVFEHALICSY